MSTIKIRMYVGTGYAGANHEDFYSLLAAFNFAATMSAESYYLCTSEFQNMKKGDTMSNVVDFL